MTNFYSILINTCDKFDDCWDPFFKLFSIYWPDYKGRIYLNTEYKNYDYEGLHIIPLKVCQNNHVQKEERATWSQCLKWALEGIDSDIVLYMQEDYFLKDVVKNDIVEKYVELMYENPDIQCIHLTDQAVTAEDKSVFDHLNNVLYSQRYRVSCQAALWRKAELLNLIREYENAWEFEEFGSMRSAILKRDYYAVDKMYVRLNHFEIIPYIFTGIVQGRWYKETVPLFEKHGIKIDFSKRGFANDAPSKPLVKRLKNRLNKIPKIIRNKIELNFIKKNLN
jgi:hypothetical protein